MARTFDDARRWARIGTELLVKTADLDDGGLNAPSALPGWSRKHLVAHVAANADALCNLVHWAATGEPTPMYASPEERLEGIEKGARLPAADLTGWLRRSAENLTAGMDALDDDQWLAKVVTAQGRTVPATELPWMRSREVCVHAIDLATGVTFADLPDDFLAALCDDVVAKRAKAPGPALNLRAPGVGWDLSGEGEPVELVADLPTLTAYLTGRADGPTTADATPAPTLGAWL
ncbi:maleylpyruvate isomerase family mycothiol-dependent enzyme [Streptomyces brasiliensis]|uniref:Maleylpyruvate isomerase n=1 Tax=Streptomyces brasiliensis TaxID=1954 RepID=A0A917NZF3_9ACTN|nr:maleylpyruvate isomerase family mycothiol-dependent enzyme [Streptomyces brasiliensis]GGJ44161.1 maleylpyruvate isomerase [Streptomyces brasiliensis]